MATGASGSINFGTTNINAAGGNTTAAQRASAWSINGFNNTFYSGFDNGTVAAGGVRVSAANNTTADRALGFLGTGSGTAANGNLVAQFSNATGSTVTSFLVDYTGEWWRQGGTRPSILTVQYSLGASAGAGGWNNISSFNYNVNSLINSSNTARNGDLSGNRTDFAAVNINSVSLNSGDSLWVKWFYNGNANGTGSGAKQTFALDDISVTFNGAAPPPASGNFWVGSDTTLGGSGTWVASGGTAWNTTDTDGTGQAFTANQTANFGGATAGTVTVSGTVAPEAGLNFTTTGYTVTGGTINLAGANATANTITTNTSVTATISSNMTGSNGMTKAGAGNLILSGTNSYGGGTVVNAGTLTGTTNSLQGAITNNATVVFNQGTAGTYAGSMTGTGSLTKNGAGDVTLSGTNSYSGGTTVTAGTLTGTTSSLQGGITNNATVVFNQDTTGTYAGNMTGTGSLVKDGAGDVTLGGTNSYSGGTTVTAGTLTGTTTSLQGAITNNAAVVFNQGTAGTYAGDMGGSGSLTKSGAGNLSLSGTNSYSGGTTVSAGTLTGTTTSLQGNIANTAAVVFDQGSDGTYSGAMSGTGTLAKTGDGAVTLTGNSSYQGGTSITGGTLVAGSNTALGTGAVTMSSGQVLGADGVTVANAISIGTAASTATGTLLAWNFNGESSPTFSVADSISSSLAAGSGNLTRGAGAASSNASNSFRTTGFQSNGISTANTDYFQFTVQASSGGNLSLGSIAARFAGTATFVASPGVTSQWAYSLDGTNFTLVGLAVQQTALTLTTDTSAVTALQGVGSATTVTFRYYASGQTSTGGWGFNSPSSGSSDDGLVVTGSVPVAASGNGTLGINTTGTTTYTGPITVNNTATLTAATGGTAVFEGAIGGSGSITKTGEGTVVLAAANTYSGGTTISAGTLSVTGAGTLGNGTVSVDSGATFDLSDKAITLELGSGFTLDGSLVMTANMSSFTNITGSGTFTFGNASTLLLDVAGITSPGSYALISGYSSYTNLGTLGTNFTGGSFGSSAYSILQSGGTLSLVVIPEPHEYALMIAGLLGVIIVIRRMRRNASVTA